MYNANLNMAFGEQGQAVMCQMCGNSGVVALGGARLGRQSDVHKNTLHRDLVRSVAFGDEFVLSGSYDLSIKVSWGVIGWCLFTLYVDLGP